MGANFEMMWHNIVKWAPIRWVVNLFNGLFFPIATVWHRERPMLLLFCSVNLLVAQLGILWSFWFAAEKGVAFGRVLDQHIGNASFYVFAVSLLVTTTSILVAEYLETDDTNPRIELRGHKVAWAIVAGLLVLFQVAFTGSLISESMQIDKATPQMVKPAGVAMPEEIAKSIVLSNPTEHPGTTAHPSTTTVLAARTSTLEAPQVLSTWRSANQVGLWFLSMFIAVHIFCLSRMHKHPQEMHQMRERQIDRAKAGAEKLHMTSDDVRV